MKITGIFRSCSCSNDYYAFDKKECVNAYPGLIE